jgi:hypothetical protein
MERVQVTILPSDQPGLAILIFLWARKITAIFSALEKTLFCCHTETHQTKPKHISRNIYTSNKLYQSFMFTFLFKVHMKHLENEFHTTGSNYHIHKLAK